MAIVNTIYNSAYQGDLDAVKNLLEENPMFITMCDSNARMLIHWAAMSGNVKLMTFLLDQGSPFDPLDECDVTPLILAASAGKYDIVKILFESGANVNSKTNQGHSALQYACSKGWLEIAEFLLDKEADVNIKDVRYATPLHRSSSKGNTAIVKLLLDHNDIKINERDSFGNTPLHLACEEDRQEEAKMLVKQGADTDIRNKDKKSPLDLCSYSLLRILSKMISQDK